MPNSSWIEVETRKPTMEDADFHGCVLAWHVWQGVMIVQHTLIGKNSFYTHWMTPPEPPKDYKRIRDAWNIKTNT